MRRSPVLQRSAPQANPAQPAVRNDVDPGVGDRSEVDDLILESEELVGAEGLLGKERPPEHALSSDRGVGGVLDEGGLDRAAVGVVSLVVAGVDLNPTNDARHAKLDDQPLVAGDASAARLPAVAHVDPTSGRKTLPGQP